MKWKRSREEEVALNKTALIEEIAGKANASKSDAQRFFDAFTEVVTDSLKNGEQVQITGFGKFYVQKRDARQGITRRPSRGSTYPHPRCRSSPRATRSRTRSSNCPASFLVPRGEDRGTCLFTRLSTNQGAMQALVDAARRKQSVLVAGLDPIPSRFPQELHALPEAEATLEFCRGILEAVEPYVAAVKMQAAFFERLGPAGMEIYADLIEAAKGLGLPAIADVKRGDIGPVAAAYAEAHLGFYGATCATVNPYMGEDAVLPFLEEARKQGGG